MALLIATFTTTILGCGARLTLTPNNVAVLQGAEVTMTCRSDSSKTLIWRMIWNGSVRHRTIYTGNKITSEFQSLYRISVINEGEVDLIIIRANEETAKTYVCEEYGSGADYVSAELIVLASVPTCANEHRTEDIGTTERFHLQLVCRLQYWGNWTPVMQWKCVSEEGSDGKTSTWINEGVFNKSDGNSIESALTVGGSEYLNGTRYICIIHFKESNRPMSAKANNTPAYSYIWEYSAQKREIISAVKTVAPDEPGGNSTVSAVVTCLVILLAAVSTVAGYIVFVKRKQTTNENHLTMDAMEELRRTYSDGSQYVEIGLSSNAIGRCRISEEPYTDLDEQDLAKADFYSALEEKQGPRRSTKANTLELYATARPDTSANDRKSVVKNIGEGESNKYLELLI